MKKSEALRVILFLILLAGGCGKGAPLPSGTPPPGPPTSIHFFAFGDEGTGDMNQRAVADETHAVCQSNRCDFGLLLGDNFYGTGVASVDDPQWQTKYRDMYADLGLTIYAALGNHDWDPPANPQAEIDYTQKDPSWQMPGPFFSFRSPQTGSPLVEIFVINSNRFDGADQSWLSSALAASSATWKIVAFHHPIFNNGTTHPPDEKGIYPTLKPIICGKVDLLLSGHEHIFSHLRDPADGCGYDQLIVGTGGQTLYIPQQTSIVLHTEANFGLGFFEVSPTKLMLHFFRATGEEAYAYTWTKP
jgi:tartrate-resistant acid phosphatase type 5